MANLLKPKSVGKKVLEYVWYADDSVKVYDLSGSTTLANKKTSYTVSYDNDQSLFVDAANKTYTREISGNDISGNLYRFKFFVADNTGILPMNHRLSADNSGNTFDISTANIVNIAFSDRDGNPYYDSYNRNYKVKAPGDISLGFTADGAITYAPTDVSFNFLSVNNNLLPNVNVSRLRLDLSSFDLSANHVNPVIYDCSLAITTNLPLVQGSAANVRGTDVSTNVVFKLYKMGIDSISDQSCYSVSKNYSKSIDICVNCISSNAYLVIDASVNSIINRGETYPQANQEIGDLLPARVNIGKAGRNGVSIPFTLPAEKTGFWAFTVTLHDSGPYGGDFTDEKSFTFTVNPSLHEPVVSLKAGSSTDLSPGESATSFLHLNELDYTIDVSNNNNQMYYRLRMLPANNSAYDISLSDLSLNFTLTDSSTNILTNYLFNSNDASLNTLTRTDVNAGSSKLVLSASDLSFNTTTFNWQKDSTRDLSNTILLGYRSDASSNRLPDRSFNIYADWLANTSSAKPQTTKVGTFNVVTPFSCNVQIVDNRDGTFTLSSTDTNNFDSNTVYNVQIFTNNKLETLAPSGNLLWTGISNSNISQTAGNSNNFNVQMDNFYSARFTAPKVSGTSKYIMVAYVGKSTSESHKYTISNLVTLTSNISLSLLVTPNPNALALSNLSTVINVDEALNIDTTKTDLSGYIVQSNNQIQDLSFNIGWPTWWADIKNPTVTVNVVDSNNIVKLFDVSGNFTKSRSLSNSVTLNNMRDLSNNIFIDLSYNKYTDDMIFGLNIAVSDENNTVYKNASVQMLLYYKGQKLGVDNTGGVKSTLIIHNDTKYVFENVSGLSQMVLGAKDSYNSFSWLSGSSANNYCLNLARSEFVGENNHTFDVSGCFDISYSSTSIVSNSDVPLAYISYANWASTSGFATKAAAGPVNTNTNVATTFSKTAYSWIDIKKFVGCIDIRFNTRNSTGNLSLTPNILRLVVIPRPTLQLTVSQVPNVLVGTTATIQTNLQNVQQNKAGVSLDLGNWNPADVSGNSLLISKIRTLLKISGGALNIVNASGLPDINNAALFTLPASVGDIAYGSIANTPVATRVNPTITFKGRPLAGQVSTNLSAVYNTFNSKQVSQSSALTVNVYSTDSIFNNNVYSNGLSANNQINFNGMPFVQYVSIDNSNNIITLDTDSRTKNSAFVFVENKSISTATVTTVTSGTLSGVGYSAPNVSIAVGETYVFSHTGTGTWVSLYKKL
jgi:hypothetical protein